MSSAPPEDVDRFVFVGRRIHFPADGDHGGRSKVLEQGAELSREQVEPVWEGFSDLIACFSDGTLRMDVGAADHNYPHVASVLNIEGPPA